METEDTQRTAVKRYCTRIARDRLLVQAAGGNVSWKSDGILWIKASGTWLADAEQKEIFVPVDRAPLDVALAHGDYAVSPRALDGYALRPSIETLLHAVMPHKFVVHLHPVEAMAHLARTNRENDLHTALGDAFAWDLVSYHKPGADLAQAIHSKLVKNPDIQVVLLENHGVIVGAETLIEVDRLLQILNQKLSVRQRSMNGALAGALRIAAGELDGNAYRVCPDATMHLLACDPELYERLDDSWAICPDHVVFLGAKAVRIDDLADLSYSREAIDSAPPFIFVKDAGVLESIAATPAQKAQLVFYLDVMIRQPTGHRLATLSYDEVASLLNWDAEKYRQSFSF